MTTLHHKIIINTPVEKVWKVLADLEAVHFYNPTVKNARYTSSNKEGKGASRHCEVLPKGYVKEQVIEWEENHVIGIELVEHQWPVAFMRWRTELQPKGDATLVTQDLEYENKFGIFGKILNALVMRKKLDQTLTQVFQGLKEYVETGANKS